MQEVEQRREQLPRARKELINYFNGLLKSFLGVLCESLLFVDRRWVVNEQAYLY